MSKERLDRFLAGKGFYIALFACVIAIGVTGYTVLSLHRGNGDEAAEPTASVETLELPDPVTVPTPAAVAEPQPEGETPPEPEKPEVYVLPDEPATEADWIWPVNGSVVQVYSADVPVFSPTLSDWRVHTGVDLAARPGTEVLAVCDGTVSAVYDDDLMGTTVVVTHEDGLSSLYANLQEVPAVHTGDTVRTGDVLGAVGATALAEVEEAPHLHLEVLRDGVSVDPREVLPGRGEM